MTERRIVYQDANGVRRTAIFDTENPGQIVVKTEQVLDEILAGVARDRENQNPRSDIRRVATLPVEVFERMVLERWDPDRERKWLNSSDAEAFRIWRGRV